MKGTIIMYDDRFESEYSTPTPNVPQDNPPVHPQASFENQSQPADQQAASPDGAQPVSHMNEQGPVQNSAQPVQQAQDVQTNVPPMNGQFFQPVQQPDGGGVPPMGPQMGAQAGGEPPKPPKHPRGHKKGAAKAVAVALCFAILGGAVGTVGTLAATGKLGGGSTTLYQGTVVPTAVKMANIDGQTTLTLPEIYATNVGSTVGITTELVTTNYWGQPVSEAAAGSGFVISSDGYILTNYHVIDGADSIEVAFVNGDTYDAKLVGGDEEQDIAVLKIEATGLTPVVLGDSVTITLE